MNEYAFEIRDYKGNLILPTDLFKGLMCDKYEITEIKQHKISFDNIIAKIKVIEKKNDCSYNKSLMNKHELKDELQYIKDEYYQHKLSFSEKVIIDKVFSDIYKVIENE